MNTEQLQTNLIYHGTHSHVGRYEAVTQANSAMKHLGYARIRLNETKPRVGFDTGGREIGLMCLSGEGTVAVGGRTYGLQRYDSIYIPRSTQVEVSTTSVLDLAECSADVENAYPVQYVPYTSVKDDPTLVFTAGGPASTRHLNILLGKNVTAGRIVMGITTTDPGHWASWPPHEHTDMLEELYVYCEMPAPAFGVQFVYTDPLNMEFIGAVREGDAVIMPAGYHPNVACPGHSITFIWMMAAHREVEDRQFGVVNVQPDFAAGGSGLEASRK
ncbi:MAG TPA: 5-deoxy-glucuronate isomerase [Armatimonadota bacterium]|jgi:5-deoxy-glucuronate isomerase